MKKDTTERKTMAEVDAGVREFKTVNAEISEALLTHDEIVVHNVFGQRYIGAGMAKGKKLVIEGTPGNDMAAFLEGGEIEVFGNGQEAVGNTMNGGRVVIHGHSGDALGYAMRDGEIYIRKDIGYRGGIHMKEYKDAKPVIVIGETAGSFLAEYMAGGIIILLGIGRDDEALMGEYFASGIHGGTIFVRGEIPAYRIPASVVASKATSEDIVKITPYLANFCKYFDYPLAELLKFEYTKVVALSSRPFKNLYIGN
ncbi:MAG: GltB/FmdC/FwdC-like GXGXG domain-containing protein [Saccharofermentanales bacterium]